MDEKLNVASRWLLALAVILIPLTVIAIVSGAWGLNYQLNTNQWTRYLLFASWILLALSAVVGTANLITPPEAESGKSLAEPRPVPREGGDEEEDTDGEPKRSDRPKGRPAFNSVYAFMLAQACTFVVGIILYIAYMSWMLLGLQAYPTPGF